MEMQLNLKLKRRNEGLKYIRKLHHENALHKKDLEVNLMKYKLLQGQVKIKSLEKEVKSLNQALDDFASLEVAFKNFTDL